MNKLNVKAEPGKQEIVITREFDAPRERVFRAHTDPALVAKWWGPAHMHVNVEALDATYGQSTQATANRRGTTQPTPTVCSNGVIVYSGACPVTPRQRPSTLRR